MLVIGSATSALAQQQDYDRTGDHLYSYGPLHQPPMRSVHRDRQTSHPPTLEQMHYDRTYDHLYYYGPITR